MEMVDPSRIEELNGEAHSKLESLSLIAHQQSLEIDRLEKEWEQVKRKRFRNFIIAVILGILVGTIVFRLFLS
jgi:hypothetical protein